MKDGVQETNLFDRDVLLPDEEYWVDVTEELRERNGDIRRIVEYTPNNLYHPRTARNIQKLYPRTYHLIRFIIILRDPVDRLISSYRMKVDMGKEERSFEGEYLVRVWDSFAYDPSNNIQYSL